MESSVLDPFQELEKLAEAAATDIQRDYPEHANDTTYDLYVEDVRDPFIDDYATLGVIDMGDLYGGVFTWENGEWHHSNYNPRVIIEEIIAKRESRNF